MFGMTLEGDMLDSFVGELGNMIGGNMSTNLSQSGVSINITPPTVIVGQTKLSGFNQALRVLASLKNVEDLNLILAIEESNHKGC
ncbi:chemotaxis protein CheC [Effusibacillus consociatus]|uniref:Chemotaxis protein CheC n=1 Tax=Effusibacillus consociatus TaxID=1117041 RepID=A0ABV9Q0C6_9BACL